MNNLGTTKNRLIRMFLLLSLASLVFASASGSRRMHAQAIPIDRLAADLEPEIRRAMIEGRIPSAAVALVAGDRIIWSGAYGHSNIWAQTPATPSTVYLIGSTFKTMSATALLQLMEQGKFQLDEPVSKYLTEFKIQGDDPANPVTFRQLFAHTSGLPADFGPFPVWGDTVAPPLEEYLAKSLKLAKPPMGTQVYSNLAYSLIGYLVQKFSGKPYKQYIRENIFAPIEMTSTDFFPRYQDMEERLSIPYVVDEKSGKQVPAERLKASVWPAGLVYGTVHDQANWLIANLNRGVFKEKKIIGEKTLDQMMTRQFDKFKGPIEGLWGNENAGFGLTWWVSERNGERYFAHSGSVPGYTAFLLGNRDRKLGFAILTNGNRAHPHLIKLADKAIDLLKALSKS